MRTEKWHIVSTEDGTALQWDEAVIEFDTYNDAVLFMSSLPIHVMEEAEIKKCIIYCDGGYVNMSGKIIGYDDEGNVITVLSPKYY